MSDHFGITLYPPRDTAGKIRQYAAQLEAATDDDKYSARDRLAVIAAVVEDLRELADTLGGRHGALQSSGGTRSAVCSGDGLPVAGDRGDAGCDRPAAPEIAASVAALHAPIATPETGLVSADPATWPDATAGFCWCDRLQAVGALHGTCPPCLAREVTKLHAQIATLQQELTAARVALPPPLEQKEQE